MNAWCCFPVWIGIRYKEYDVLMNGIPDHVRTLDIGFFRIYLYAIPNWH